MSCRIFTLLGIFLSSPSHSTVPSATDSLSKRPGWSISDILPEVESLIPSTDMAISLFNDQLNKMRDPQIYLCKSIPDLVANLEHLLLLSFSLVKSTSSGRVVWLFTTSPYQALWEASPVLERASLQEILKHQIQSIIDLCDGVEVEYLADIRNRFVDFADQASHVAPIDSPITLASDIFETVLLPLSTSLAPDSVTLRWVIDQISIYLFLEITIHSEDEYLPIPLGLSEEFGRLTKSSALSHLRSTNDFINKLIETLERAQSVQAQSGILALATLPTHDIESTVDTSSGKPAPFIPVVPKRDNPKKQYERPTKTPKGNRPASAPARLKTMDRA